MFRGIKPGIKLTDAEALEVFNAEGVYSKIAAKYKISVAQVCKIKRGVAWNRVTGLPYRGSVEGNSDGTRGPHANLDMAKEGMGDRENEV